MWVPHRKKSRLIPLSSFSEWCSCNTHRVFMHTLYIVVVPRTVPRTRWQLEVQNCWALWHGQAFLSASLKQKPVHWHTEISSRPGFAATSMSLSSISSRVNFIPMMAGEKQHYFTSCKTSRIGTFDEVSLDVSTFQNKNQSKPLSLRSTDWRAPLMWLFSKNNYNKTTQLRAVFFHVYCDAVHVRCSASGFCIISKYMQLSVL